jgi:hypothetical protein
MKDLKVARSQGKLEKFFNSADNASTLTKHEKASSTMVSDSTVRL